MIQSISARSYKVESSSEKQIEERLGVESLAEVIMNFERTISKSMGHGLWHLIEVMFSSNQRNWI